jgi:predicted RNase H-like HicB family nuclease
VESDAYEVTVIIEPDENGYYAHCPGLPGLHVCGDTQKEALKNARDAIRAILETKIEHGDPIVSGPHMKKRRTTTKRITSAFTRHEEKIIIPVSTPISA